MALRKQSCLPYAIYLLKHSGKYSFTRLRVNENCRLRVVDFFISFFFTLFVEIKDSLNVENLSFFKEVLG